MKPAHNPSSRCVNETFTKTTRFTSAEATLINSGTYDVAEHSRKTKVKPSVTGRSSDSAQRLKPTARRRSERLQTRRVTARRVRQVAESKSSARWESVGDGWGRKRPVSRRPPVPPSSASSSFTRSYGCRRADWLSAECTSSNEGATSGTSFLTTPTRGSMKSADEAPWAGDPFHTGRLQLVSSASFFLSSRRAAGLSAA